MMSRYEAYINGIALSSIHPELIVLDIQHKATAMKATTSTLGNRHGAMLLDRYISGAQVTIVFELHIYDIAERQRVCQQVAAWAMAGGQLETNDRQGQRLLVKCLTAPNIASALKWTDPLSVVFAAYEHPFWEEKNYSQVSLTGTTGSGTLYVPGSAGEAVVEVKATPGSGTLANLTLTVGNTSIALTGISATSANPLTISYDDRMIQSIKRGSTSVLDKRSAASSDDLLAVCSQINNVSFTASVSTTVEFKARGVWL